jgi:hypothetical protein
MQEKLSKAQLEKLGMEQKVRQDCMTHLLTIQLQCKGGLTTMSILALRVLMQSSTTASKSCRRVGAAPNRPSTAYTCVCKPCFCTVFYWFAIACVVLRTVLLASLV